MTKHDLQQQMEAIYSDLPRNEIPWDKTAPSAQLKKLFESGDITPCRTLELGCGTGTNSLYLARQGFDVTAVDVSRQALTYAQEAAAQQQLSVRWIQADILSDLPLGQGLFGFIFDWEVMHHIEPQQRTDYLARMHQLLEPGGLYLSVGFSIDDPNFGGQGQYRTTALGTRLYFSTEAEMEALLSPLFHIEQLTTIVIDGYRAPHKAIFAMVRG